MNSRRNREAGQTRKQTHRKTQEHRGGDLGRRGNKGLSSGGGGKRRRKARGAELLDAEDA